MLNFAEKMCTTFLSCKEVFEKIIKKEESRFNKNDIIQHKVTFEPK